MSKNDLLKDVDKQVLNILNSGYIVGGALRGNMKVYVPLAGEVKAMHLFLSTRRKDRMRELYETEAKEYEKQLAMHGLASYNPFDD